jgi:hypothetical protein
MVLNQSFNKIGPSGVSALPLGVAAERSVHYIFDSFSKAAFEELEK